jgi:hypothetical protein
MDGSKKMLLDKFFYFFIFLSVFLFLGCAEMVSVPKPSAGSSIRVQVKLAQNPKDLEYKYIFVYSKKPINIPMNLYTFLPGIDFDFSDIDHSDTDTTSVENESKDLFINYYYQNYFSSWSDYILIEKENDFKTQILYDAPDTIYFPLTANETINTELIQNPLHLGSSGYWSFSDAGEEFHLDFQLSFQALGNDSKPATEEKFYFNFFTLNKKNIVIDYYSEDDNFIINRKGITPFNRITNPIIDTNENAWNYISRIQVRVL